MTNSRKERWSISKLIAVVPVSKYTLEKVIRDKAIEPIGHYKGAAKPYDYFDPKVVIKALIDHHVEKEVAKVQKAKPKGSPPPAGASAQPDGEDLTFYKTMLTKEQALTQKLKNDMTEGSYVHVEEIAKDVLQLQKGLADSVDEICTELTQLLPNALPDVVEAITRFRATGKNIIADFRLEEEDTS